MSKNGVVLVCVTPQHSCRHLIECGQRFAQQQNAALHILSVLPQRQSFAPDWSVLESLNEYAGEFGAEMTVTFSDCPSDSVLKTVSETGVCTLLTGFPGKNSTHFVFDLHGKIPQIPLWMVDSDGTAYTIGHAAQSELQIITDGTFRIPLPTHTQ